MNNRSFVLVSSGDCHPGNAEREALAKHLPPVETIGSIEGLDPLLKSDGKPAGIIMYYHRKEDPAAGSEVLDLLERYLEEGGKVFCLHAATASFKKDDRYKALLGGRFIGHGPIETFHAEPSSPWAESVFSSFSVRDELYRHELCDDIDVHLRSSDGEPLAWSRSVGSGEMFYLAFGHMAEVFENEGVSAFIRVVVRRLWA